jgi:hypothetical protein
MKEMMKEFRFMWRLLVVIALASDSGERPKCPEIL